MADTGGTANMRTMKVQPKSKDASVGKLMSEVASEGKDWHATNETVEHSHGEKPAGPFGGLHSGS